MTCACEKTFRRLFDYERPDQTDDHYYSLVLMFGDEGELLLPDETPEQAFHRHKNEGLLSHHDKLKKMLEVTSKKKKINEARTKMAVRMMRMMMMEVAYRLRAPLSLTMNTSYNLTRTLTLLTLKQESPCSMLTRGMCTTRSLVTSFICKNMRNKSVHAQSENLSTCL